MRRRGREVSEPEELLRIMEGCDVVRLGIWDGERPYIRSEERRVGKEC